VPTALPAGAALAKVEIVKIAFNPKGPDDVSNSTSTVVTVFIIDPPDLR